MKRANVFYPKSKMTVIHRCERSLFVDVDETLVFVTYPKEKGKEAIEFDAFGYKRRILPHWNHVEKIKEFRVRGIAVFVWSAGGTSWAEAVVRRLGLLGWVHVVPKPTDWYIDDKDVKTWMGERFYLDLTSGEDVFNTKEKEVRLTRDGKNALSQSSNRRRK